MFALKRVGTGCRPLPLYTCDDSMYLSAVEEAQGIMGVSRNRAQKALDHAIKSITHGEQAGKLLHRKAYVPGFYGPTYLVNQDEALELIDILPAKHTGNARAHVRKTFRQVEAGSSAVIARAQANAASTSGRALFARDGLGEPLAPRAVGGDESLVSEPVAKRLRDELDVAAEQQHRRKMMAYELRKAKAEVDALESKGKIEKDAAEAKAKAETRKAEAEAAAAEAAAAVTVLQSRTAAIQALEAAGVYDSRDRHLRIPGVSGAAATLALTSSVDLGNGTAVGGGGGGGNPGSVPLRISNVCRDLDVSVTQQDLMAIGALAKRKYRSRHGFYPPTNERAGFGSPTACYAERDRDLIEMAIREHLAETE